MAFLVKVEVLKHISFARRFDKGELPGVAYKLARGRAAFAMWGNCSCGYVVDRWLVVTGTPVVFFVLLIFLWKVQGDTVSASAILMS